MSEPAPAASPSRFPPQIKYIIGNEAAERFSFYGMAAILTLFLHKSLGFEKSEAETIFHLFTFGVYFTPLIGAYISDRFWGKYHTIIRLSCFYIAGHAVLALWETRAGVYAGLTLVALGAGGIKPCVSAHVGDQFTRASSHLLPKVFSAFYWSINLGSFFSYLIVPWTRVAYGPRVAFAIPGVLMALALLVFWLGRRHYVYVPPTGYKADSPGKVLWAVLTGGGLRAARARFGDGPTDDLLAVLRVGLVLVPVTAFWALFHQTGSSWVLMTDEMNLHGFLTADMLQAANPALVMIMIPLFASVLYPALERRGLRVTPLRRMGVGMFVTALSFVAVAAIRAALDDGADLSAFWIVAPYVILTAGEILVSITGLEFAYTQAPRAVKSTVMSVWFLTIAGGNLLKATLARLNFLDGPAEFLFWAGLMAALAVVFALIARGYRMVEYVEEDEVAAQK